ncbi:MAG: hypothetical protein GX568_04345 [Candidatus Gastranaerophilales bacterium]|nr:hypothetical protein [Candidatus Gastranaerophilales bacterium]
MRKYTGEGSYSTDTVYYYLDDKNKKLYDSDKKLITTITYNNDKIMIFEGNKLSDEDFIIGRCITLDRNTGEYSGSHIIEAQINGKLCRSNTPVYGSCELIENKKKF